jgi:hypothetical protein
MASACLSWCVAPASSRAVAGYMLASLTPRVSCRWRWAGRWQEVDGHDKIVELVNDVIVSLLQSAGERRPSALATNRKFARFIRALIETDDDDLP